MHPTLKRLSGLALLLALLATTIITPGSPAHADPGALELPAEALLTDPVFARSGFAGLASLFANRTRYLLALDVDSARGRLLGRARILFVNSTPVALNEVALRLYGNHPTHGSRTMTVTRATVNGQPAAGRTVDFNATVYRLPLGVPLAPGGQAAIDLDYQITIPASGNFFYVSEPFPMMAVYDGGWREEVATKGLDYVYSESALFAVRLRAPSEVGTWYVGAAKSVEKNADGTTTYTIVTGPVRNFILIQARGWGTLDISGGSVPIRVLYSGDRAYAKDVGEIAAGVMNFYNAVISPYPYAEFDMVVMNFPTGGEEYPGVVFVHNQGDAAYRRFITAHETGHQWFYGIAGNDTLRHAWLDESLVQIGGFLYWKRTQSPAVAEEFWLRILRWYNRRESPPKKIDTALEDFRDFEDYMSTIYGEGAVFLRNLSEKMGDNAFLAGLRTYVQAVNLGIGTPVQFFNSMQAQTTIDLKPLFCQRVGIMC